MKKITSLVLVAVAALAISFTACKSKPKDADIKTAVEAALAKDGMMKGSSVTVEKGVATISGECKDDACKAACEKAVSAIKGVKSVVNNCTVAPPAVEKLTTDTAVDALSKAVTDAVKDFGVSASVKDQVATITGEIVGKDKLQKLMMALNGLKAMGLKSINTDGLVKK